MNKNPIFVKVVLWFMGINALVILAVWIASIFWIKSTVR